MDESAVPQGKVKRSGIAAVTTARVGARHLRHRARTALADETERERLREEHERDVARLIFRSLSRLRGTALKIAQALSMELEMLPEALRKELAKSCYQAPPINRALVRRIIIGKLGAAPEQLFERFDAEPFAAASLGQVHALRHQGRELALKIQYPGIASTIDSDTALVAKMTGLLPKGFFPDIVLAEIRERLLEETDYELEAERTMTFYTAADPDHFLLPRVWPEFSAGTLLCTERLPGLHLQEWLATDPQDSAKQAFAEHIANFLTFSISGPGIIHADPNPGNFLFCPDGRLGVLDFGCVRVMDRQFVRGFINLMRAFQSGGVSDIIAAYEHLGLLDPSDKPDSEAFDRFIKPWAKWCGAIFAPQGYDFGANPGTALQGKRLHMHLDRYFTSLPRELVFFDRTLHGYFRIFEQLQARVRLPLLEDSD